MKLLMSSDKAGRFYYYENCPDRKYRSVSTILHWGQPKGKASDAAKIGTWAHYWVFSLATGWDLDVPTDNPYWTSVREVSQKIEDVLMMWGNLKLDEIVDEWIAVEEAIVWEGDLDGIPCWYAGRLDGIARCKDGKLRMMDLKCGDEYPEYGMQLAGYVQGWEQMHPDMPIGEAWNIYCDVGSNYIRATNERFQRNPYKVPRIRVWAREEIDIEMKKFNEKVKNVFIIQ